MLPTKYVVAADLTFEIRTSILIGHVLNQNGQRSTLCVTYAIHMIDSPCESQSHTHSSLDKTIFRMPLKSTLESDSIPAQRTVSNKTCQVGSQSSRQSLMLHKHTFALNLAQVSRIINTQTRTQSYRHRIPSCALVKLYIIQFIPTVYALRRRLTLVRLRWRAIELAHIMLSSLGIIHVFVALCVPPLQNDTHDTTAARRSLARARVKPRLVIGRWAFAVRVCSLRTHVKFIGFLERHANNLLIPCTVCTITGGEHFSERCAGQMCVANRKGVRTWTALKETLHT